MASARKSKIQPGALAAMVQLTMLEATADNNASECWINTREALTCPHDRHLLSPAAIVSHRQRRFDNAAEQRTPQTRTDHLARKGAVGCPRLPNVYRVWSAVSTSFVVVVSPSLGKTFSTL